MGVKKRLKEIRMREYMMEPRMSLKPIGISNNVILEHYLSIRAQHIRNKHTVQCQLCTLVSIR